MKTYAKMMKIAPATVLSTAILLSPGPAFASAKDASINSISTTTHSVANSKLLNSSITTVDMQQIILLLQKLKTAEEVAEQSITEPILNLNSDQKKRMLEVVKNIKDKTDEASLYTKRLQTSSNITPSAVTDLLDILQNIQPVIKTFEEDITNVLTSFQAEYLMQDIESIKSVLEIIIERVAEFQQ
ncbi:hypothetical protein [Bacillus toyonensis]|uniref:Uncharacterized protein n=1 Tax=Bacillus toyonensis TaxID=155322 RepID=A0A2A8H4Y6_9BACI|nr:hypothetical protein [Bacillus toyonensis]PEP87374.1 hypothetical protein CN585_29810 [Bacillus toyonensis]